MNRRKFLALLVLTSCCDDMSFIINPYAFGSNIDLANSVFVIFEGGQSNSTGRATSQRTIQLTEYKECPSGVKIYFKPDYTTTDNGTFQILLEGSAHTREPDQSGAYNGAYGILASLLRKVSPNTVYIVMAGDGGVALKENLTSPDWYEGSSGEAFEIFTQRYYNVAYPKIQAEQPGKTIYPIICWHQGETDAADPDGTSGYAVRFGDPNRFVDSLRASHSSLSGALMVITKLYYLVTAGETTINAAFQAYADAHSSIVKIIDISDIHRRIDLTADEIGGVAGVGTDDEHTSYLGHRAKALRTYDHIKAKYFPTIDDSEHLTNAVFDPSTLGSTGIRLQFTRSKMTIGQYYVVSAVVNDFSLGTFSTIVGSPRFKIDGVRGCIETLASTTPRIQSSAAIGSSLIDGSFSLNFFMKPRDGNPAIAYTICHDIQNTGSPNNSRFGVFLQTDGTINCLIAVSGTAKQAITNTAVFANGDQLLEKHIAITLTNGNLVRIYVDGVLQTLNVTNNGDISAINLANYVNTTNVFTLLANRSGASTYNQHFFGHLREFDVHTGVVYSQADINNLMLN